MRWATYCQGDDPTEHVGLVVGNYLHALPVGATLLGLLGDDGERLARAAERATADPAAVVPLAAARLRPPLPRPPSVRDFYAFEQHVRTARLTRGLGVDPGWYEAPVFYFTNPHALIGPGDAVPRPPGCLQLDFELEVAVVVGRDGANLPPAEAARHIVGYTIMNDWSARDLQRREMRQGLGPTKAKDFATSLGPWLVTPDELPSAGDGPAPLLTMTATVNGREYSRASLADLYWSFGEMLSYASRGARIAAGDVVGSGTCGTGCILELSGSHGEAAYPWLVPGDQVVLCVDGLGELANRVAEGPGLHPLR